MGIEPMKAMLLSLARQRFELLMLRILFELECSLRAAGASPAVAARITQEQRLEMQDDIENSLVELADERDGATLQ